MEPAAAKTGSAIESGVAVLIVRSALLRITQNFVRLAQFLEFLLSRFVFRVLVRMIFYCELSVRLFDFLRLRTFLHAEDFVVAAFGHGSDRNSTRLNSSHIPLS